MALIACTECKKEISTAASTCPGCGAPTKKTQPKKTRPVFKILGGLLLVLFAVAVFSPKKESTGQSDGITANAGTQANAPTPTPIEIKASQLDADYHANEVSADMKYKGKLLRVAGVVASINKDVSDDVWIGLAAENQFMPIHAAGFSPNQVADLKKGDLITITCAGAGMIIGSPMLKDCTP